MTIVIFGSGGKTGSSAVAEAASRGHHVTPVRSADADITDPQAVARAAAGHDVAIAGVAPAEADPGVFRSLPNRGRRLGVPRPRYRAVAGLSVLRRLGPPAEKDRAEPLLGELLGALVADGAEVAE
uniref:Sugar nucleotide-binding protein n=1 Tax=Streptomyces sp. NBC_01401 TaxID=2903854 RepID=A0AAU3H7F4_9ACTN